MYTNNLFSILSIAKSYLIIAVQNTHEIIINCKTRLRW